MPQATSYHDDFELEPLEDDFVDEPDLPLPLPDDEAHVPGGTDNIAEQNVPKWFRGTRGWTRTWFRGVNDTMDNLRPRWLNHGHASWTQKITDSLRPRFTVGYVLASILAVYVFYCYITWSPLLASKLPKYTGPHEVGAIDVEVPVQEPRKIVEATFKKDGTPAFELDTVLFTLYYPTIKGSRPQKSKHKWFPKPISLIAEGYATAAHFNNFFSRQLFTFALWGLASSIEIPAKVDVPLLESHVGDESTLDTFPVVILSHGDVSSRTDYTAYCGELASRGVIVAAIEHRDGSCPGSIVHLPDGKQKRVLLSRADQLQPSDPDKEVSNDDWRFKKLAFRDAEIQETITLLQNLNAGKGNDIYTSNYRNEGKDLYSWQDRLDLSQFVIAGHSFGATGALQALKSANKTDAPYDNPAIGGIILDPGKSSGRLNPDIDVPLLIVHSDSWSKAVTIFYGRPHFDTVRDIAKDVLERCGVTWFMTSLKTSHPSVTDAPLIEPYLLSWTTGATINVKEGLREYVRVSMEFLQYLKNGTRAGVLNVGVTHENYGNDTRSEEQKKAMEKGITKYWEVHVAPPAESAKDK